MGIFDIIIVFRLFTWQHMYLFVPCDQKSHGLEIKKVIGSNRL